MHTIFLLLEDRALCFQNNPKDLDPSYKMDLGLSDSFGRVKLILAKFHRADFVLCSHSGEGKTPL